MFPVNHSLNASRFSSPRLLGHFGIALSRGGGFAVARLFDKDWQRLVSNFTWSQQVSWFVLLLFISTLLGIHSTSAQQPDQSLYYDAIENLDTGNIIVRGTATQRGIPRNELILPSNTSFREWPLEADTGLIGRVDFRTTQAGHRFTIPSVALKRSVLHGQMGMDGKSPEDSIQSAYGYLSVRYGENSTAEPNSFKDPTCKDVIEFAENLKNDQYHSNYSLLSNNCKTFGDEAVDCGRQNLPTISNVRIQSDLWLERTYS